jgi:hypothetical protein
VFQALRTKFGIPGLISVIALVFVMGGAAYAAKSGFIITKTSQIKPSVLKSLQGKDGAVGPAGSNGSNGTNGAPGGQGKEGPQGPKGKEGPAGPSCDPSGECLLPSGATETGVWAVQTARAVPAVRTAISFPLRLSEVPTFHFIPQPEVGPPPTPTPPPECPGTSSEPKALPGNLCIYEGDATPSGFERPPQNAAIDGKSGMTLYFFLKEVGGEFIEEGAATGSWAVTAP